VHRSDDFSLRVYLAREKNRGRPKGKCQKIVTFVTSTVVDVAESRVLARVEVRDGYLVQAETSKSCQKSCRQQQESNG
jgi:hypothetical protein